MSNKPAHTNHGKRLEEKPIIKDYVEAAYLHGLCAENLDTGELEPPKDISEIEWITEAIQKLLDEAKIEARIDELNSLANELAQYTDYDLRPIKDRLEELKND